MAAGQPIRGFVAQSMAGKKKTFSVYTAAYPVGTFTWTCPKSGWHRFIAWGAGGNQGAGNPSASGAHNQTVVYCKASDAVALVISASADTTITFPSGRLITAGRGVNNTAGVSTGGDLNLAGSVAGVNGLGTNGGLAVGGGATGGGGAPGDGPYRGGDGGSVGWGGGANNGSGAGPGAVLIVRQNTSRY